MCMQKCRAYEDLAGVCGDADVERIGPPCAALLAILDRRAVDRDEPHVENAEGKSNPDCKPVQILLFLFCAQFLTLGESCLVQGT